MRVKLADNSCITTDIIMTQSFVTTMNCSRFCELSLDGPDSVEKDLHKYGCGVALQLHILVIPQVPLDWCWVG